MSCHCKECERHEEILKLLGFQLGRVIYASVDDTRTEQQAREDTELLISHAVHGRWDELESLILDIKAMQNP